jgi:hypothetical protein
MIDPTRSDIGRKVCYTGNHGGPIEEGVITSFNDSAVFVRYADQPNSKATYREDLRWMYPHSEGPKSERCPTCGEPVESVFDHLDLHHGEAA